MACENYIVLEIANNAAIQSDADALQAILKSIDLNDIRTKRCPRHKPLAPLANSWIANLALAVKVRCLEFTVANGGFDVYALA